MSEQTKDFYEQLEEFDTAMLVTHAKDGQLRARPMQMAEVDEDGQLWFVTELDSAKVEEVMTDSRVNVSLQDDNKYLSITGRATIVRNRAKIQELWNETWKIWFPNGEDDPNLALLHIQATEGEYWDMSGMNKLKFLFEAGKALATGTPPELDNDDVHQKVEL